MPCRNDYEDQPSIADQCFPGAIQLLCDLAKGTTTAGPLAEFKRLHNAADDAREGWRAATKAATEAEARAKEAHMGLSQSHPAYKAVYTARKNMERAETAEREFLIAYGKLRC